MSSKPGPEMKDPTPTQVLQFVRRNEKPFVTTNDVADQFNNVTSKTVRERLKTLEERGELEVRKVGAHSKVWYIPDQGASPSNASDSRRFPSSDNQ